MMCRLEREQGSFLRTLGRSNSVCLYRRAKERKFTLCVPKMQIALVPIKRNIKFNVVDTFIRVSASFLFSFCFLFCFGFLHRCHCKTTLSHLHPVLHCYLHSVCLFNILRLSTIQTSDSILAKDITLDCSKA